MESEETTGDMVVVAALSMGVYLMVHGIVQAGELVLEEV